MSHVLDPDLSHEAALRLYQSEGPFVSAYLPAPSALVSAGELLELRWKNLRRDLEVKGAAETDLAALDAAVHDGHKGGETLVAVAARGDIRLRTMLPTLLPRRFGDAGDLPMLTPLLAWRQSTVRQLIVNADRVSAEFTVVDGVGLVDGRTVDGDRDPIHKPQAGGWSQKRYQQRAENTWERNARGAAQEAVALVDDYAIDIVHLAGDQRAVGFLRTHLPTRVEQLVRRADHPVTADDEVVRTAQQSIHTERTARLLSEFAQRRAQRRGAVEGAVATLEALSDGRVGTLLVPTSRGDTRRAWFGERAVPVGMNERTIGRLAVPPVRVARLVEVAVRAALGTGADVWFIPPHGPFTPVGGIGALTRF